MTATRNHIARLIWGQSDPFRELAPQPDLVDFQGWGSDHPYLTELIDELRPKIIVEIGVWKGGSTIKMAEHLRLRGIDGVVISIDTWLGAWDHWTNAEWFPHLRFLDGYPTIYRTFTANISARGLEPYVVPLPLDSNNASHVLRTRAIVPDLIHIDAGHDVDAVTSDLKLWWPVLAPGGALIGDDYRPDGGYFPGVRDAFHAFFESDVFENRENKCVVRKALDGGRKIPHE